MFGEVLFFKWAIFCRDWTKIADFALRPKKITIKQTPCIFFQGPRTLKKSGGAKGPKIPEIYPPNRQIWFLLHFYVTIFQSQGGPWTPRTPQVRGPWAQQNVNYSQFWRIHLCAHFNSNFRTMISRITLNPFLRLPLTQFWSASLSSLGSMMPLQSEVNEAEIC